MKALRLAAWLAARLVEPKREPDFIVGGREHPYLRRWYVIPRNPFCNVYLHQFLRSDDDRALHDHPWPSVSLMLRGRLLEHTFAEPVYVRRLRFIRATNAGEAIAPKMHVDLITAGSVRYRGARFSHRLELPAGEHCWTLFLTGPTLRAWGFWCEGVRWVHWRVFTDTRDGVSTTGQGCE